MFVPWTVFVAFQTSQLSTNQVFAKKKVEALPDSLDARHGFFSRGAFFGGAMVVRSPEKHMFFCLVK